MEQTTRDDVTETRHIAAFPPARTLVISRDAHAEARKSSRFPGLEGATAQILRGRNDILARRPLLDRLAANFGQPLALSQLEYFLTLPWALKKIPHLVMISSLPSSSVPVSSPATRSRTLLPRFPVSSILGAVLVQEYAVAGIGTGIFATDDTSGVPTVLAHQGMGPQIAMLAASALVQHRAEMVLISCRADSSHPIEIDERPPVAIAGSRWATPWREVRDELPLRETYDETLSTLGKHTRRNLRYYRRRAEKELEVEFIAHAQGCIRESDFLNLNLNSTHPVTQQEASRRFNSMDILNGGFLAGLRRPNGEWLSIAGGWHQDDRCWIEWQLNRGGLQQYSVSTAMRSYMLETFIARKTRFLTFLGGTPHSMSESFTPRWVVDVVLRRQSLAAKLVKDVAKRIFRADNRLRKALTDPDLQWTAG